jgi:glycerophosphoryl diester phosphodiesterase
MKSLYFTPPRPRILAHRGNSVRAPENSFTAFEEALAFTPYLETDLRATRDGVLVFHHDADLQRSCGINQKLGDLTFAQIQDLRIFGSDQKIPQVEEALRFFPNATWNIEIKDPRPGIEEAVFQTLVRENAEARVLIAAENDEIMKRFRSLKTGIPTSAGHEEMLGIFQWLLGGSPETPLIEAQAFQIPTAHEGLRLDRPELIHLAHQFGVEVHFWTINDAQEAARLLRLGADGIVTDDPQLIGAISLQSASIGAGTVSG